MNDTKMGHVPGKLIYGPVNSRRFGRSLGLSLSLPDRWTCSWRCPYCQIGHQPRDDVHKAPWPSLETLQDEWQQTAAIAGAVDAVTLAGSGEPTLHPDFANISSWLCREIRDSGASSILLTNGDGLLRPEVREAALGYDRVYVKFDPGAPCGAWRRCSEEGRIKRMELLADFRNLRLQSLIFRTEKGDGNSGKADMARYFNTVFTFKPQEIHLTTVDREAPSPDILPVQRSTLSEWSSRASELGVSLTIF